MFTQAIVRQPGPDYGQGITTAVRATTDYDLMLAQHQNYVNTLRACGLDVLGTAPLAGPSRRLFRRRRGCGHTRMWP